MSSLITQQFDGAEIRIIQESGEPLFCAKDVCDVLGYKNTSQAISDNCREGVYLADTPLHLVARKK